MKRITINYDWVFRAGMLLASILCLCPIPGQGQCPRNMSDLYFIQKDYDVGSFEEILALKHCRSSLVQSIGTQRSLKDPDKVARDSLVEPYIVKDFLKVFLRTAIAVDSLEMAGETMAQLLRIDPKYRPDPQDPVGLIALADSFVPYSPNHFGITLGFSRPIVQSMDDVQPFYYLTEYDGVMEKLIPSYQSNINRTIGLEWNHSFGYRNRFITGASLFRVLKNISPRFYYENHYHEWLTFLQVPILFQHRIPLIRMKQGKKIFLALHGGCITSVLLAADAIYDDYVGDGMDDYMFLYRRARLSTGLEGGVSLGVQSYGLEWFLRSSIQLGITTLRRLGPEELSNIYSIVPDYFLIREANSFRLHGVNFAVGFMIPRGNRVECLLRK